MRCFGCGTETALASGERVGFRDTCARCGRDLHACRNCAHHDPSAYNECREPNAEWVTDRERRNFCDYFSLNQNTPGGAGAQRADRTQAARSKLDQLFKPKGSDSE